MRIARIVDSTVAPPLAEGRFAGVVMVAKDGRPVFAKGYGLADRERRIAHTPATPFMIMSVSKQFTAAVIARLAVAGKLRFEDHVSMYLEDWPASWSDVQIRHLLSHSSGLPIDTAYSWLVKHHPEFWPGSAPPPPYEPLDLPAPPGTKYQYANVGYTLLTLIAAKAGGAPFDELLREEVVRPLALEHTVPERNGIRIPGRARGYQKSASGLELKEQKTIDIVGAGDLVSTASDLVRFDAAFDDDRFVPASIMLTPKIEGARGASIGYGWFVRTSPRGRRLQYHTGDGAGFRAFNFRVPDKHLAVVVLSNVHESDVPWIVPLVDRIADAMR